MTPRTPFFSLQPRAGVRAQLPGLQPGRSGAGVPTLECPPWGRAGAPSPHVGSSLSVRLSPVSSHRLPGRFPLKSLASPGLRICFRGDRRGCKARRTPKAPGRCYVTDSGQRNEDGVKGAGAIVPGPRPGGLRSEESPTPSRRRPRVHGGTVETCARRRRGVTRCLSLTGAPHSPSPPHISFSRFEQGYHSSSFLLDTIPSIQVFHL